MEGVELVLAEPAALLVAQRRGDAVLLEPGTDAGQVVLVDERQRIGLEKALMTMFLGVTQRAV